MAEGTIPKGIEMETLAEAVVEEGLLMEEEAQESADQPVVRPKI